MYFFKFFLIAAKIDRSHKGSVMCELDTYDDVTMSPTQLSEFFLHEQHEEVFESECVDLIEQFEPARHGTSFDFNS